MSQAERFLLLGRRRRHVLRLPKIHRGQFGPVGDHTGDAVTGARVAQRLVVGRAQIDVLIALAAMPNGRVGGGLQFLPLARHT